MSSADEETIASEVLAASLGGAISAAVLYPLEVVKTKMQATTSAAAEDDGENRSENGGHSSKSLSMIPFMKHLYQTEGASVFFHGMETSSFQSALEKALYFFAYTGLKEGYAWLVASRSPGSDTTTKVEMDALTNLLLGCAAEWAHLPITLPVDAWTTRIQTQQQQPGATTKQAPMAILLSMLNDKNVNFYKGIQAYWLLCFKPALQYTVYERVKAWMVQHRSNKTLGAGESFLLGMIARTVSTILVFPFLRAKVLLQAQQRSSSADTSSTPPAKTSITSLLLQLLQRDGFWAGWYQGLGPELTRGVLSAALMLMIKEQVAAVVRKALLRNRTGPQSRHPLYRRQRLTFPAATMMRTSNSSSSSSSPPPTPPEYQ